VAVEKSGGEWDGAGLQLWRGGEKGRAALHWPGQACPPHTFCANSILCVAV